MVGLMRALQDVAVLHLNPVSHPFLLLFSGEVC